MIAGIARALWTRLEDMWTVEHPPPMVWASSRPAQDPTVPERPPVEPTVPASPPAVEKPVYHTCSTVGESSPVDRSRCQACRQWAGAS